MRHIVEQLRGLGYIVTYEYNPIDQLVYYIVYCGEDLIDMGLADEITLEGKLKEVCEEYIRCAYEVCS